MEYEHPIYTPASVAAQRRLPECDTDRIVFAGAWHGWGFHEDGARSGVEAAARLGVEWGGRRAAARSRRRRTPPRSGTSAASRSSAPSPTARAPGWSTSTTCPTTVSSAGSRRATTSATRTRTIKANVEHFLALNGVEPDGGRIVMAANARALGHCFNPISVFWCHRRDGDLAGVVVEVHNTYGDRHAYLVHPDEQGRARTEKQMYVSPFHGTDGYYEIAVPRPGRPAARLRHAAQRRRRGRSAPRSTASRTTTSPLRSAPAALRGTLLIHAHGIWLWARRLGIRTTSRPPATGRRLR